MSKDLNDQHKDGTAPTDPLHGLVPQQSEEQISKDDALAEAKKVLQSGAFSVIGPKAAERMGKVHGGDLKATPSPWANYNREMGGGFWPGLHVLVGNPKAGKSQFAIQCAEHAAKNGAPVIYVSLELTKEQLWTRVLGLRSGQPWSRLWLGEELGGQASAGAIVEEHQAELSKLPFYCVSGTASGWDPEAELPPLVESVRSMHPEAKHPPFVVIDFLQLASSEKERELRLIIRAATYAAKTATNKHNAVVLAVSSTSREGYFSLDSGMASTQKDLDANSKRMPPGAGSPARFMGKGKESGEIEYAADNVIVLLRDHETEQEDNAIDTRGGSARGPSCVWAAMAAVRAYPKDSKGWAVFDFDGSRFNTYKDSEALERQKIEERAAWKPAKSETPDQRAQKKATKGSLSS